MTFPITSNNHNPNIIVTENEFFEKENKKIQEEKNILLHRLSEIEIEKEEILNQLKYLNLLRKY